MNQEIRSPMRILRHKPHACGDVPLSSSLFCPNSKLASFSWGIKNPPRSQQIFVAFGGYIVLVVMSPVYSWLSERTEAHLTGREFPFSFRQFAWEIFRGILIALRNMIFQLFISFVLFLCSFIPLVGVIAPFAIFFTSAYFYGFAFIDYAIERKRFNVRQSVRYVNKNIGLVTGIGTVFALALMIPALSLAACCFVSLLSVIAGTIAVERMNDKSVK